MDMALSFLGLSLKTQPELHAGLDANSGVLRMFSTQLRQYRVNHLKNFGGSRRHGGRHVFFRCHHEQTLIVFPLLKQPDLLCKGETLGLGNIAIPVSSAVLQRSGNAPHGHRFPPVSGGVCP